MTFQLSPKSSWAELLIMQGAFSKDQPIYVSGVYYNIQKRPKDWPKWGASGSDTIFLCIRKVLFRQGDLTARHPFAMSHYQHKRQDTEFELSEIVGLRLAERLAAMLPRIGHSQGGLSYSEGSSRKGSPSKREPASPPLGSDI